MYFKRKTVRHKHKLIKNKWQSWMLGYSDSKPKWMKGTITGMRNL